MHPIGRWSIGRQRRDRATVRSLIGVVESDNHLLICRINTGNPKVPGPKHLSYLGEFDSYCIWAELQEFRLVMRESGRSAISRACSILEPGDCLAASGRLIRSGCIAPNCPVAALLGESPSSKGAAATAVDVQK